MTHLSRLGLQVAAPIASENYPTVRILIDGVELLNPEDQEIGNDPEHLFGTGALIPQPVPRRIAFYGCGCGSFGCSCVAGLVTEADGVVRWTDFRTVTGVYHSALPPNDGPPDPTANGGFSTRLLPIPDLAFDARQYHQAVALATADRTWETRTRVVVRLLRERLPDRAVWAEGHGARIQVRDGVIDLPAGTAQEVADTLAADLKAGRTPPGFRPFRRLP